MKTPKLDIEFGWSVFKCMFILLIFTNLLWAGIYSYTINTASSDSITTADVWQEGENNNNNQRITNG